MPKKSKKSSAAARAQLGRAAAAVQAFPAEIAPRGKISDRREGRRHRARDLSPQKKGGPGSVLRKSAYSRSAAGMVGMRLSVRTSSTGSFVLTQTDCMRSTFAGTTSHTSVMERAGSRDPFFERLNS